MRQQGALLSIARWQEMRSISPGRNAHTVILRMRAVHPSEAGAYSPSECGEQSFWGGLQNLLQCPASTIFSGQRQLFLPVNDNYTLYEIHRPFYTWSDRGRG
jgi:hypothetical protein